MPIFASRWTWTLISAAVLVADQWSKWWVEQTIPKYSSLELIPGLLAFTHVKNPGVAFGLLADASSSVGPWLVTLLGLAALGFVVHLFRQADLGDRMLLLALTLVAGGAVGNLVDRVVRGEVTDFVDVSIGSYHWHTFNVADSAISVGLVLLVLDGLRSRRRERQQVAADASA